jgi:hypothetical protein
MVIKLQTRTVTKLRMRTVIKLQTRTVTKLRMRTVRHVSHFSIACA